MTSLKSVRRWVVVAATLLACVMLGEMSIVESQLPARVGLQARWQGESLVVSGVEPAGLAWTDGIKVGDRIVAIDGAPPSADTSISGASSVAVLNAQGDVLTTAVPVPASPLVVPTFIVTASLFLLVGGVVFVVASDVIAAAIVLGSTVVSALMLIGSVASLSGAPWATAVTFLALLGFGATTFLLALVFPINRLHRPPGRWAAALGALIAGVLALWYGIATLTGSAYAPVRSATGLAVAAFLLGAAVLVALAVARRSPQRNIARRATVRLALGAIAGLLPFCALSIGPSALGFAYLLPPELTILSVVFLPATLAAALLSRQFPGVDRLVSRGLVALIVWLGLLVMYALGLTLALSAAPGGQHVPVVGTLALTLATFPVLQARLRRRVERALFRDIYDPAELVRTLGEELVRLNGLPATADHILARIGSALDLSWVGLSLNEVNSGVPRYVWGHRPPDRPGTPEVVGLVAEGEDIGYLAVGAKNSDVELLPSDYAFLELVRPLISTALHNALLVQRLEAQVLVLAERERALAGLNTRLVRVQEEERRSLALDLHDDALQRVVLLARDMSSNVRTLPETAITKVERWREATQDIAIALRAVCRDLRPPVIDDLGLSAALDWLVSEIRSKSDLEVHCRLDDVGRLEAGLEIALYRVAQEGLNNVRKHADASAVVVTLERDVDALRLSIADDGKGIVAPAPRAIPSLGVLGMRERVAPWGGVVRIERNSSGGTTVWAEVPLMAAPAALAA